ncbi:MAG TPA: phosphoribosyltransferase family protein [Clostridiales bacterium]|nr:phosphoribosyltransferase family protein [Clostridiales bacterium]
MGKTYDMTIAGLKRHLPICQANEHLDIAAFVIFGDTELTVRAATELLKKCPEFDYILTPEAKGIPLAYEMAKQAGKPYFVIRKATKLYMTEPFGVEVHSITTEGTQHLYMDKTEADAISGKRVLIVDDVISTGDSLQAVERLVAKTGAKIVGRAAILAEGDAAKRDDLIFLEPLPLFFK